MYRLLVRLTLRQDVAEDLLQDLVIKLSQADGFEAAAQPYAYARAAAMNLAFSWMRSRRQELTLEDESHPTTMEAPPWLALIRAEEVQQLLRCMNDLSEQDRLILTMRYFDEAGYGDISQVVGCTAHQARGLCHKALGRLRVTMTQAGTLKQSRCREEVGS